MRVSITFVLAVCAPLLALAAPISINPAPPAGTSDPDYYSHSWKRDTTGEFGVESVPPTDWKRTEVKPAAIAMPGWKRDDEDTVPTTDWKRSAGTSETDGAGNTKDWKRSAGTSETDGYGNSKDWKA